MRALRHLRMHAAGFAAVAGFYYPDSGKVSAHHLHNVLGDRLELLLDGIRVQQEILQLVKIIQLFLAGGQFLFRLLALGDFNRKTGLGTDNFRGLFLCFRDL